jgi:hypothetical protein
MFRSTLRAIVDTHPVFSGTMRAIRDQLDRNAQSFETAWGFSLAGHKQMAQGRFEPEETELIRSMVCDVDVFVNVGANVGYYCLHAFCSGKSVLAVEPIQRNLHYLLRNIRENGMEKRAEIYPVALGAECGIADMFGGGGGRVHL